MLPFFPASPSAISPTAPTEGQALAKSRRRSSSGPDHHAVAQGLAEFDVNTLNTLIVYTTSPRVTADDGDGAHTLFTAALLNHLGSPGLDIRQALGRVRDEVLNATEFQQEPYVTISLGPEDISLLPSPAR